jgi:uncharacterized protein (DUF302 family)
MLHVPSKRRLEEMEAVLCRAAQHHDMRVLAVIHLGRLMSAETRPLHDVYVFTVCHAPLYAALLSAEPRFATILPCRIAAREDGNGITLETITAGEFSRWLGRDDLDQLTEPLDTALQALMQEASLPSAAGVAQSKTDYSLGATEIQVNVRGTLPHRLDCHGTHVEDLAGTGKLDAPGG